MQKLTQKQKILAIFVIIISLIYYIYSTKIKENNYNQNEFIETNNNNESISTEKIEEIQIYITGEIQNVGVYKISKESRIIDVINQAGGLTQQADISKINLADKLEDGTKIYIPKIGEENQDVEENVAEVKPNAQDTNIKEKTNKKNKININTATIEELDTLPGIGISTAQKIINYRKENGKFKNIEEIKEVNGIGESKYEKIKEMIYV